MRLPLKKSFNNWVVVSAEGEPKIEFLIDYPTREQEQHLQSIQWGSDYSGDDRALKYAQYFLKCTIKNWKCEQGEFLIAEDGSQVKCKLVNNELEDEIWWMLAGSPIMTMGLFPKIREELEFNANDKKK